MATKQIRFDILQISFIRKLIRSPAVPLVFQVLTFLLVVILAVIGFRVGTDMPAEDLLTLRKTNLTTLLVWGLWWPAMIIAMVAFGRVWCMVCPLEMLSRLGDALARRLGLPRLTMGKFLRSGWMMLAGYFVLQIGVAFFLLHRLPHATAILLIALASSAFFVGLVFRGPRAFCRGFCPAGAVLSVYARHTPIQLEMIDPDVCATCETKDCIKESNRYRLDARSCPSLLRPFDRTVSDVCVLCLQCAKVCPHDNVGFGLVSADAPIRRRQLLRPFEAAFVLFAFGFLTHEIVEDVHFGDQIFAFVPEHLAAWLGVQTAWVEKLWYLGLFQVLFWTVLVAIAYLAGHKGKLGTLLLAAATGAAPVVAVAHVAKATAKLTGWVGYLPGALADPNGMTTFRHFVSHPTDMPAALLGPMVAGWLGLVLLVVIAHRSMGWIRKLPRQTLTAAWVGLAGALVLFAADLSLWAFGIQ